MIFAVSNEGIQGLSTLVQAVILTVKDRLQE